MVLQSNVYAFLSRFIFQQNDRPLIFLLQIEFVSDNYNTQLSVLKQLPQGFDSYSKELCCLYASVSAYGKSFPKVAQRTQVGECFCMEVGSHLRPAG